MLRISVDWIPEVKPRPCRAGRVSQSMLCEVVKRGKLRALRTVIFTNCIVPPMLVKLPAEMEVTPIALMAVRSPVMDCTPSSEMSLAVFVAMAMDPVKVVHPESAVASPWF